MNIANTEVWGFKHALRGMRNPMNSWHKSDSLYGYNQCGNCNHNYLCEQCLTNDKNDYAVEAPIIGKNDLQLAQTLVLAGGEHRKFMRQIFVSVDITAPLYWWKEFDTYKVGTVVNSTSTMHKLATTPITLECFETDDYESNLMVMNSEEYNKNDLTIDSLMNQGELCMIDVLEKLRQRYLETKDKRFWKELIRWLPESWLQTRTITLNYENLRNMYFQRKNHKLTEWSKTFCDWVELLPYAKELICYTKEKVGE